MAEMNEISKNPSTKKLRQSISIPFMWEEKPGMPKKGWKPRIPPKTECVAAPVKFIASVPFKWEEKPGIPLPYFSQTGTTSHHVDIISLVSPPRYSEDDDSSRIENGGGGDNESCNEISESELDDLDEFYSDSFSSAPSIMEDGLILNGEITNDIPVDQMVQYDKHLDELQCTLSPTSQAESSTSSYATESASLTGRSFLEWLFPLLTPTGDASFKRKVDIQEKINTSNCLQKHTEEANHEIEQTAIISRPLLTLGELIMMSRRRSYQRKAMRRMKSNSSMELMKTEGFGCYMFGTKNSIRLLHQKCKNQFQLKLL